MRPIRVRPDLVLTLLFLGALAMLGCGGGGGASAGTDADLPVPPPFPDPGQVAARASASRFLGQATLGARHADIAALAASGDPAAWIQAQRALPPRWMSTALQALRARFDVADRTPAELDAAGVPYEREDDGEVIGVLDDVLHARFAWWSTILQAPDQLRQRVAYALSQLLVVSDIPEATSEGATMAAYYDILQHHALGSYRALLEDISYSTAMGLYLTHMGNDRGDPSQGVFPDENYARELMQLFTIGLWELNADGTRRLDGQGAPIPTYDNRDITELARVFTGLGPNGEEDAFQATDLEDHDPAAPMAIWEAHHATGPKRLIDGSTTDGTTAQDIDAALDALVRHPNTAPFVSAFLIRRLVTSNPTPAYVGRVAAVFVDNGAGVRGDLGAVVEAILLDPEARNDAGTPSGGKVREPALRYVQLLRAFGAQAPSGLVFLLGAKLQDKVDVAELVEPAQLHQHPLSAPSVFNFYRDDHQPQALRGTALVAPEMQIVHATSIAGWNALLRQVLFDGQIADLGYLRDLPEEHPRFDLAAHVLAFTDMDRYASWAGDPERLVRELDILLAGGDLSDETCQRLVAHLRDPRAQALPPRQRTNFAIYLVLLSPEYLHRS